MYSPGSAPSRRGEPRNAPACIARGRTRRTGTRCRGACCGSTASTPVTSGSFGAGANDARRRPRRLAVNVFHMRREHLRAIKRCFARPLPVADVEGHPSASGTPAAASASNSPRNCASARRPEAGSRPPRARAPRDSATISAACVAGEAAELEFHEARAERVGPQARAQCVRIERARFRVQVGRRREHRPLNRGRPVARRARPARHAAASSDANSSRRTRSRSHRLPPVAMNAGSPDARGPSRMRSPRSRCLSCCPFSPEWNRFHLLETDGALRFGPTP